MNYSSLIRPWHAPVPRRRRYYGRHAGARMVAAAFLLPLILSLYLAFYAAYVYWVALVTLILVGFIWPLKVAVRIAKLIIRKVAK